MHGLIGTPSAHRRVMSRQRRRRLERPVANATKRQALMTFQDLRSRRGAKRHVPIACVMGGMDLVRPLGRVGVRCAVVARPGSPALYSRFTDATLTRNDFSERSEELVDTLVQFGAT